MRGSLVLSLRTELKKTSGSTFSAPSASPVVLLKLRNRPFTVTMNWVGPTAPMVSGGTNPGVSEIVAPVKLVPIVCGVEGAVDAGQRRPPGSCDTSGERRVLGERRPEVAFLLGLLVYRRPPGPIRDPLVVHQAGYRLGPPGPPGRGVPACQIVADVDPPSGTRRNPTATMRARATRSAVTRATVLRAGVCASGGIVATVPERLLQDGDAGVGAALDGSLGGSP